MPAVGVVAGLAAVLDLPAVVVLAAVVVLVVAVLDLVVADARRVRVGRVAARAGVAVFGEESVGAAGFFAAGRRVSVIWQGAALSRLRRCRA